MVSQVKTQAAGERDEFLELPRSLTHAGGPAPRIDAFEIDGLVEMIAEVPGVPESAIDVTLDGDILTIEVDKAIITRPSASTSPSASSAASAGPSSCRSRPIPTGCTRPCTTGC